MLPDWRGKVGVAVAATLVATLVAEGFLWLFLPQPHPYALEGSGQRILDDFRRLPLNRYVPSYHGEQALRFEPDLEILPGVSPVVDFTINQFGFRSARMSSLTKPTGTKRIFAIGGSTTECLYLDDRDAWPEVLQRTLETSVSNLDVINAGRSGDTTRDHIALLAQRIVSHQPDAVLILAGINDLGLHLEADYSPTRADTRSRVPEPSVDVSLWLKSRTADVSQIARLAIALRRTLKHRDAQGNPLQDLRGAWIQRARQELRRAPLRTVVATPLPMPEFEQNLRTLVGIARSAGAEPVLLTQPVIWGAPEGVWEDRLWVSFRGRIAHQQLWRLMERFNDVTRRLAGELQVPLVDLARALPKSTEIFYDDDHFTMEGARRVALEVSREVLRVPELRRRLGLPALAK